MKNRQNPIKVHPIGDIILEIPTNMSQRDFKIQRSAMNQKIRDRIKNGFLVYKAAEIFEMAFGESKDGKQNKIKQHRTFPPFAGSVKKLSVI